MIALAAAVALLWRALLGPGAPLFGNLLFFFHPLVSAVTRDLQSGRLPLWNPRQFCGIPLWADPQAGVLCPTQIFHRFFGFAWGLRLELACEAILAALLTYCLARRLGQRRGGAWLAGLLMGGGGFLFSHAGLLSHTASALYLPGALLFWSAGAGWLLGLTLALQVFGGHPFFLYMTLVCGLFLRPRRPLKVLGQAAAIGVPLAAAQLFPTAELFSESVRAGALQLESLFAYAVPPDHLWRMLTHPWWNRVAENFTGDPTVTSFYMGVPALILALGGFWSARSRAPMVWAGGGLALMLGPATPLYGLLLKVLPGLSLFRFPAQWGAVAALGLALLAGWGVSLLGRRARLAAGVLAALDLWGFSANPAAGRVSADFYPSPPAPILDGRLRAGDRVAHSLRFFSAQMSDVPDRPRESEETYWGEQKDALVPSHGTVFGLRETLSDNICRPRRLDALARASLRGGAFPQALLRRLGVKAWIDLEDGRTVARMVGAPLDNVSLAGGEVEILVQSAARMSLRTRSTAAGALFWSDSFFPGWRAWVDGRPAAIVPAEVAFRSVALSAGPHEVGFRYDPLPLSAGLALAAAALASAGALAAAALADID